ncbi:UDP-N-acetylmuramoyl-L-alanine--D-glutamate ligase [Brevundimonas lutea]|uniref:UDP-N-acetylmuramoyl-L-alanine--D-glutamate ligase n=1 Tax=Brevundimonas lutea TaxID=2293980 RepID=UPI000F0325AC|nr:UDP-N-acetylmuramoyl-L-alanine--D-glutamate ligase [Brevundimonas lutea]
MIPVPGFEGQTVAVFGLGRSGLTAARALRAGGANPVLWDDSVSSRMQAEAEGFELRDLTTADWSGFAALVLSPGAPLTHPAPHWTVDRAREAGVEIIGDLELFARALAALPDDARPKVIGITGTNGKSTTTALIGWVLKQAGMTVHVGGNIGIGVLALPAPTPDAVYVIECSSYQLDLTTSFAPDVATLTNISPDHLDRHGDMAGYVAAKARIFQSQGPKALALVGVDGGFDVAIARDLATLQRRNIIAVSTSVHGPTTVEFVKSYLWASGPSVIDVTELVSGPTWPPPADSRLFDTTSARSLPGRHNAQNAAFAYAAATALGVSHEDAVAGLLSFPGLAHRMEHVGTLGRVRFINDSKATNADAARQALSSYDRIFWIAGGRAKAGGIDDLADLFPRVTEAFLIGEAAGPFAAALGETPHRVSGDMASAVAAAAKAAAATGRDEVVLLSPAAASFDQFPDFEARGEAFRAAVLSLGAAPPEVRP